MFWSPANAKAKHISWQTIQDREAKVQAGGWVVSKWGGPTSLSPYFRQLRSFFPLAKHHVTVRVRRSITHVKPVYV
jgi:hypothetical protein